MTKNIVEGVITHNDPSEQMPADGGDCEEVLLRCFETGFDFDILASRLQNDEAALQTKSWIELLDAVAFKSAVVAQKMNEI